VSWFSLVIGQNASRQLATSSENLVASAQFVVALATSESQFRALDNLKIMAGCGMRDVGFGIKISWPEQHVLISTRKCGINLILRGGMWDKKQQITVTQCLEKYIYLSKVFGNTNVFVKQFSNRVSVTPASLTITGSN